MNTAFKPISKLRNLVGGEMVRKMIMPYFIVF